MSTRSQTTNDTESSTTVAPSRTGQPAPFPGEFSEYVQAKEKLDTSLSRAEEQVTSAYDLDSPSDPETCLVAAFGLLEEAVTHHDVADKALWAIDRVRDVTLAYYRSKGVGDLSQSHQRLRNCLHDCELGACMVAKMRKLQDNDDESGISQQATLELITQVYADAQRLESLIQSTMSASTRSAPE
ncbi:hypothetical protein JCM24511_09409 [Saitozyma sp. JCM 24511]|nr:hypothetical protein JCM24511_09409 [Saitozyma sp. JCM 24511]